MTEVWVRSEKQYGTMLRRNNGMCLVHLDYEDEPRWFWSADVETFSSRIE